MKDFTDIYRELGFLSDSVRLQYTNFIWRHRDKISESFTFENVVKRMKNDEPIEYVFNCAEFCGLEFYVDRRVLIPRHETEEIVRRTLDLLENVVESWTIIDVGTGSGCILLSIAKSIFQKEENTRHKFIGIDISGEALEVAALNRGILELSEQIELLNTSFQEFDFSKFQNVIICSNLPYIPNSEELQRSVVAYEPHLALFGGEKGNELNKLLLAKLKELKNIKAIFMEGENGTITSFV